MMPEYDNSPPPLLWSTPSTKASPSRGLKYHNAQHQNLNLGAPASATPEMQQFYYSQGIAGGTENGAFFPTESPLTQSIPSPVSVRQSSPGRDATDTWWWRDNVIIGRLSALARRYWSLRMCARPFRAWSEYAKTKMRKREFQRKQQIEVVMHVWKCRALHRCFWRELPLLRLLNQSVCRAGLRSAWNRLRSWANSWRMVMQRQMLLHLVRAKMMNGMAVCHHMRSLYLRGLGAFWVCTKSLKSRHSRHAHAHAHRHSHPHDHADAYPHDHSNAHPHVHHSYSQALEQRSANRANEAGTEPRSVLLRVQSRTWRRWRYATLMWLSQEKYQQKQHQHATLWLLRNQAMNSIGMCHRVLVLLRRGFEGLLWQAWVAPKSQKSRRRSPGKRMASVSQGGGLSSEDVKRKVWHRWQFALTVEDPIPVRPEWVSSSLAEVSMAIENIKSYDSNLGSTPFINVPFPNLPEDRRNLRSANFPPWATEDYRRVDNWSDAHGPLHRQSDSMGGSQTSQSSLPFWLVSSASRQDAQMLSLSPKRPAG